jgi:hypothetical protein
MIVLNVSMTWKMLWPFAAIPIASAVMVAPTPKVAAQPTSRSCRSLARGAASRW